MEKVIVLYGLPDDPEHFRTYYKEKHIPLVEQMPFLIEYSYSFDVQTSDGMIFCLFEATFSSRDQFLQSMSSECGVRASEDTKNYTSGHISIINYSLPG
jgi:uncharacterized protein (TIGR02118 family)